MIPYFAGMVPPQSKEPCSNTNYLPSPASIELLVQTVTDAPFANTQLTQCKPAA